MKEYNVIYVNPMTRDPEEKMNAFAEVGWRVIAVTYLGCATIESCVMVTMERDVEEQ